MATREEHPPYEFPVDPPVPETLPPGASIGEVEPLRYYSCLRFYREDIERYVEQPLVEACRILYDKNVLTTLTSANREDVERGTPAALFIDYATLSEENQAIAREVGELVRAPGIVRCVIAVPLSAESTVGSISADAVAIVERLEPQSVPIAIQE